MPLYNNVQTKYLVDGNNNINGIGVPYSQSASRFTRNNVALGVNAMPLLPFNTNEGFLSNVGVGFSSLVRLESGVENIAIGERALNTLVEGSRNIAIGANSGVGSDDLDETVAIGARVKARKSGQLALGAFSFAPVIGDVTINKPSGRVRIGAGNTNISITNSLVDSVCRIFAVVSINDATAFVKNTVAGEGGFDINLAAPATATTSIDFFVFA